MGLKQRILVLDRDDASRHTMVCQLNDAGYEVDATSASEDAIARVTDASYHLVLIGASIGAGAGLSARIKAAATGPSPAVAVVSGDDSSHCDSEQTSDSAPDAYISPSARNGRLLLSLRPLLRLKAAEQALEESEQLLRNVIESASHGVFLLDEELSILVVNANALLALGWPAEARAELTLHDLCAPEFVGPVESMIRAVKPGHGLVLEATGKRKNGDRFPVEFSVGALERSGRYAFALTLRDLSRRSQVEATLERERAEHRSRVTGEVASVEGSFGSERVAVTTSLYGLQGLAERMPEEHQTLCSAYRSLLETALERRGYSEPKELLDENLKTLARRFGFLRASPRDVVEVHSRILRAAMKGVPLAKQQVWLEEGRLTLLEVMGHLVNYYRQMAFGLRNSQ